jgi:NADP-dependent 3-hydroxy acid dehydrogenase YdfG
MATDRPLDGAVALITGASTGIGAATARRLAQEGAAVALVARRRHRLEQLAADIVMVGGVALVVESDITDPQLAEQAVLATMDRFSRLDILVNSASVRLLGTALQTTLAQWDRMIELNIKALVHVTHAAVPYLIDAAATAPRQVADIVNISSTAGQTARPASSVYTLTKFGLNGFTESLRQEMAIERVRVGVVQPGRVDTEFSLQLDDVTREQTRRQVDDVEALRPDDVAQAVAYIVTRDRGVAVNEMVIRAAEETW